MEISRDFSRKSPKKNVELLTKKTSTILSSSHLRKKTKTPPGDFSAVTFLGWWRNVGPKTLESLYQWPPSIERNQVWANGERRTAWNESSPGSSCWILTLNNPPKLHRCQPTNQPGYDLRLSLKHPGVPNTNINTNTPPTNPTDQPTQPTPNGPTWVWGSAAWKLSKTLRSL